MTQLDDNFDALMAKDAGAPVLANNYIVEAMMGSAAVNRDSMKTSVDVSQSGTLDGASGAIVNITLDAYSFFPMIHINEIGDSNSKVTGHTVDGASADSPRFGLQNTGGNDDSAYDVDYRYIGA